jgi:hypothetical protein
MSNLTLSENQSKISALTSYLATLASTAENHFWNGITNDFNLFGATGNTDPLTVATDMCAASEQVCNQILIHLADMTGETATEVSWTASVLTQWATPVSLAIQRIAQIVNDITAITTSAPDGFLGQADYDIRGTLQATFATLYDQAEAVLNTGLGPHFPPVRTTIWPVLTDFATPAQPATAVAITAEVPSDYLLTLTLLDALGATVAWNGDGNQTGFNEIEVGDLLYIDSLSVTGFEAFVGNVYEVDAVDGANERLDLIIPYPGIAVPIDPTTSLSATSVGQIFRIRKVKGIVPPP